MSRLHNVILIVHAVLAIGFFAVGMVTSAGADGWADLARVAVAALAGAYFVGATLSWAVARLLVRNAIARTLIALAGPPLMVVLAVLFLRAG